MNKKILAVALGALSLAACAQQPVRLATTTAPKPPQAVAALPHVALTEPMLFDYLLGSLAGQRGDQRLAATKFLDLARQTRDPRLARQAAQVAFLSQQNERAMEAARLWLELQPQARQPQQMLAVLLLDQGQLAQAKPYLQRSLAKQAPAERNNGFLMLNSLLARYPDKKAAQALVDELAQPYQDSAAAHLAMAQAALHAGSPGQALAHVQQARRLNPAMEVAVLLEGQILEQQDATRAAAFYQDYLKAHPKADNVRLAYARALAGQEKAAEARTQFRQLLAAHPHNPDVTLAIGLLSFQMRDYDTAERDLKQALHDHYPDADLARIYLGQLNEERKRDAEAQRWYHAVKPGAHYLEAQFHLAGLLGQHGKLREAQALLRHLPAGDARQQAQIAMAEARLYRDAHRDRAAYQVLGSALKRQPDDPDLLYEHALAADKLNQLAVAEHDLRRVIQLKPDAGQAYNALGYTLADKTTRYNEALALIKTALKMMPNDPMVLDSMGWVQYRLGHLKEAQGYLQRAYDGSRDPEIAAHLGEVLWANGQPGNARAVLQATLKSHPGDVVLLRAMKKVNH